MNKEVNEKKKRYAIVITFLVLMICITGGTYAYFALTASNNSVTGSVGGASLNLEVTKVYPTSEHNNKNMIPQLESTLDEAISTTNKCIDGNGNVICQVYSATVTNVGSTTSVLNGTISFTGIENMPNLKWMRINDSNTLGTYSSYQATTDKALFESERSFGANTSQTYYFVFWIDETGEVQTDSGTFRANIEFDSSTGGLTSTVRPLLTEYIETLYNDGSTINSVRIADNESKQLVNLNSNQKLMQVNQGDTYGTEYRYYSASPNNYVEYNGELWRIISSSKVFSSETDATGETRVRIIREDSIGSHPWDNNNNYDWATSTLMSTLNNLYYNKTSGTCYLGGSSTMCDYVSGGVKGVSEEARSLISDVVWYLGGSSDFNLYADDLYSIERNINDTVTNLAIYTDAVGLVYPSDYLYAADLSVCKKAGFEISGLIGYSDTNCKGTDWLYDGTTKWTISSSSSLVWQINMNGYIFNNPSNLAASIYVHPVVALNSNVRVTGGAGTSGNPYRLGI